MSKIGAEIVVTAKTDYAVKKLKDVADGTTGVRKAVDDAGKGSAVLSAQLGKMQGALEGVNKKLQMVGSIATLGGAVQTIGALASGVDAVVQRSRELAAVQQGLKINIDAARQSTGGLVNDYQLMTAANKATTLGVVKSQEEYAKLAGVAAKLGSTMGLSASQAVDDLTTALGRGSVMILDNLGISLKLEEAYEIYARQIGTTADKLDDAEKKQAFMTVALQKAKEAADKSGVTFDTHGAKLAKLSTAYENLKDKIIEATARGLVAMVDPIGTINDDLVKTIQAVEGYANATDALNERLLRFADRTNGADSAMVDFLARLNLGADQMRNLDRAQAEEKTLSLARERYAQLKEEEAVRRSLVAKAENERRITADTIAQRNAAKRGGPAEDLSAASMHRARDFDGSLASADVALELERRQEETRKAALEQQIADEQLRLEMMQMQVSAMDEKSAAFVAANDRIYESEMRLLEMQKQVTTDKAALFDLEAERRKKALQRQIDAGKRAAEAEAFNRQLGVQALNVYEGAMVGVTQNIIKGIEAGALGQEKGFARTMYAFTRNLALEMGLTSAKEAVLALVSVARYDYAGAAMHGVAAAAAGALAGVAGGAAYGIGTNLTSAQRGVDMTEKPSVPARTSGGSGGTSGGSSSGASAPEFEAPLSFELRRGVPRRGSGTGAAVQVNVNGSVIGEGGRRELGRYFVDVAEQADPRKGWR